MWRVRTAEAPIIARNAAGGVRGIFRARASRHPGVRTRQAVNSAVQGEPIDFAFERNDLSQFFDVSISIQNVLRGSNYDTIVILNNDVRTGG